MQVGTRPSPRSLRPLVAWALLLGVVVAVGIGLAPDASAQADDDALVGEPIGDVALGAQLYALNCASCHAANGLGAEVSGTGRMAPPLADSPEVTAAYVDLVMRTGRMPPAEDPFDNRPRDVTYDEVERLAIVAFTIEEFGVENDLFVVEQAGDAGRGQELWAANCAACHGATGQGGVAGGGAWTPTVYTLEPTTIGEAIRVGPFQMPAFEEAQISDQGMADIGAFMHEVGAEQGTPLGLVELNPVFASGFVALLAVVMLVSLTWISGKPSWFPDPDSTSAEEGAGPASPEPDVGSQVSGGGVEQTDDEEPR